MYLVLYKDDFGEKHIATYDNYKDAYDFYRTPSNVLFPHAVITIDELWEYVNIINHL